MEREKYEAEGKVQADGEGEGRGNTKTAEVGDSKNQLIAVLWSMIKTQRGKID